jgi:hypothetical protein
MAALQSARQIQNLHDNFIIHGVPRGPILGRMNEHLDTLYRSATGAGGAGVRFPQLAVVKTKTPGHSTPAGARNFLATNSEAMAAMRQFLRDGKVIELVQDFDFTSPSTSLYEEFAQILGDFNKLDEWAWSRVPDIHGLQAQIARLRAELGVAGSSWFRRHEDPPAEPAAEPAAETAAGSAEGGGGSTMSGFTFELPGQWDPMPHDLGARRRVQLAPDSTEYQEALARFLERTPEQNGIIHNGFTIVSIERNQDTTRWVQYNAQKMSMEQRHDHIGANELQLFHGTSAANVELICANGFDRSFSSVARFGDGVYFARDLSYSANTRYAEPERPDSAQSPGVQTVILARVLVGAATKGAPNMPHPPIRHEGLRFDSLADDPGPEGSPTARGASIIVSCHNDNQSYAEYVIKFKRPLGWSDAAGFVRRPQAVLGPITIETAIQSWVQRGFQDQLGTPGRLELSAFGLDDRALTALVTTGALAPHLGRLVMITLHNTGITTVPTQLLTATLQHISVSAGVHVPNVLQFNGNVGRL